MLDTKIFGDKLKSLGFSFCSGVPCSFLKYLINYAINNWEYIAATNEGEAVAITSGAYLGGKKSVVLMQNSGLTNAASPLTSLNFPFRLPLLGFVSLRGEKNNDEPQHELMGQITTDLLDQMRIKWDFLNTSQDAANKQLGEAINFINDDTSYFFVVKKNTFDEYSLTEQKPIIRKNFLQIRKTQTDQMPSRLKALELISQHKDKDTVILATTGKTGRELYEIEDSKNNLYMVGSMGCISSLGLGLALVKNEKKIIVIDGDGSILMRMGSLATIANNNPTNMLHLLLDNNCHDSTGGQLTVSSSVDFVRIAASCGYTKSIYVHSLEELNTLIEEWKRDQKLTFVYMRITKGSKKNLGRPKIKPYEVKERLMKFLNE